MARRQGIPVKALQVESLSLHGIELKNVTLGSVPPLILPSVTISYDRHLLLEKRIGNVVLKDLAVPLSYKDGSWQAPWAASLMTRKAGSNPAVFPYHKTVSQLPFTRLKIEHGRIKIDGDLSADIPFDATLEGGTSPRLTLTLQDAQASQKEAKAALQQVSLQIEWNTGNSGSAEGTVSIEGLSLDHPAFHEDLSMTGQLRADEREAGLTASFRNASGQLKGRGTYHMKLKEGLQNADIAFDPIIFVKGGLQPQALSALIPPSLKDVAGTLRARFTASKAEDRWDIRSQLGVKSLSLTANGVPLTGITGDVKLAQFAPFLTAGAQKIHIDALGSGPALTDVSLGFELKQDVLLLQSAQGHWLEGDIRLRPLALPLHSPGNWQTAIDVRHVSLEKLLGQIGRNDLSATGILDGTLPVRSRGGILSIEQGELLAENGTLAWKQDAPAGGNPQMEFVRRALSDIRYSQLKLGIEHAGMGAKQKAVLEVTGKNPGFQEGRPIQLTLTLNGDLTETLLGTLNAYAHPEKLLESPSDGH